MLHIINIYFISATQQHKHGKRLQSKFIWILLFREYSICQYYYLSWAGIPLIFNLFYDSDSRDHIHICGISTSCYNDILG